jgi:hypothetical protein
MMGEKMKFRDLSFYIEPSRMVRLMKLIPSSTLVTPIINGVLNYIFKFITFHIFERMSDNMDSIIVISY